MFANKMIRFCQHIRLCHVKQLNPHKSIHHQCISLFSTSKLSKNLLDDSEDIDPDLIQRLVLNFPDFSFALIHNQLIKTHIQSIRILTQTNHQSIKINHWNQS